MSYDLTQFWARSIRAKIPAGPLAPFRCARDERVILKGRSGAAGMAPGTIMCCTRSGANQVCCCELGFSLETSAGVIRLTSTKKAARHSGSKGRMSVAVEH
jgi:hypothetical protein